MLHSRTAKQFNQVQSLEVIFLPKAKYMIFCIGLIIFAGQVGTKDRVGLKSVNVMVFLDDLL
jgi:hypothetical protein